MSCMKCLGIFLSSLVLVKGLAGLVIGILALVPSTNFIATLLVLTVALGFGLGVASVGQDLSGLLATVYVYYIIIAIGGLGLFIGIWSIVAAAKRNKCMLITAAILLALLLAFEVILTAFTGVGYSSLTKQFTKEKFDDELKTSEAFHKFEMDNKCCGIEGPGDYVPETSIPSECCIPDGSGNKDVSKCQAKETGFVYTDGCGKFNGQIADAQWIPLGVLIAVSCITLLTLIVLTAFCCNMRKDMYA